MLLGIFPSFCRIRPHRKRKAIICGSTDAGCFRTVKESGLCGIYSLFDADLHPLAYYYGTMSNYLGNTDSATASTMTIGQMSEIFFMILIFFFRKLVKWMILIGMLAWVSRYVLFAIGAPEQIHWMIFLGVALHGICYDFFVTGFMYTDRSPGDYPESAQSMLVFFTQGIGMYVDMGVLRDFLSGPIELIRLKL